MTPTARQLRTLIAQASWDRATSLLRRVTPDRAAEELMALPFEEQQALFRRLPLDLAAALTGAFPYYHAYVLLHSRPTSDVNAIVNQMNPAVRLQFFDQLPEEAWQRLMAELQTPETGEAAAVTEPVHPPEEAAEPIIVARGIEKRYERPDDPPVQVIAPTNLVVEPGMIIALLGPSGSGKSTLLRILTGLSEPSAGEVSWHGKPVSVAKPNVAIVFQSFALFPWLTVLSNVEVPLEARGMEHAERHKKAVEALAAVGLNGFENAYPKELSGGMRQRVGFARALAVEPEILFMDEPFSALDVLTAENLRGELLELWLNRKIPTKTIFMVTHNIEEAVLLADRIIVLGRNPARIRADFRLPLSQPRDKASAEFLLYVDYVYKLMTQPELAAGPAPAGREPKVEHQVLPHARRGAIAGLLELLNDRGGREDLYRIADELRMEVDDLLPIVEACSILGFARSEKGDVEITPEGKAFAEADIGSRKQLFRQAALTHVALLQQMLHALESKSDHTMPLEFFRDLLQQHFSDSEAQRQIDTALNWGRYGDIINYDSESDRLSLYHPAELVKDE